MKKKVVKKIVKQYSEAFKQEAVELAKSSGKSVPAIAKHLGVGQTALRRWIAEANATKTPQNTSNTRERELERENRELREEVQILKKAAAFFAKNLR